MRPPKRSGRGRPRLLVGLAAAVLVIGACGDDGDVESAEGDPETIVEQAQEEDFRQLVVDQPFEGTAVVTEVISPRAFRLFDTLVVSGQEMDLEVDERVRVRGTVRRASIDELERQLGVDFDDPVAAAHDGDLLVVAEEVTPVDFPEPLD